jgi:hypothetical protein
VLANTKSLQSAYVQSTQTRIVQKITQNSNLKTQILSIDQTTIEIKRGKTNRQVNTTKVPKTYYTRYEVMIILQQSGII